MKKFNQLTEKQMAKANGGLIIALLVTGGITAAAAGGALGLGIHLDKKGTK